MVTYHGVSLFGGLLEWTTGTLEWNTGNCDTLHGYHSRDISWSRTMGCLYSVDYWNGLLEHWNGILEWITGMATYLTRCSLGGKAGLGPDSNYITVYFITAMYLAFRLTAHTLNR